MEQKPIDIKLLDLERMKEKTTETPGLLPYAHTVGSAVIRPEDVGKISSKALSAMRQQTEMQMAQLYQQMQLLATQAAKINARVAASERIYQAQMPFEPLIGHHYYLYQKKDGTDMLSMIAPDEWGKSKPFSEFVAKVTLLADHTWEIQNID